MLMPRGLAVDAARRLLAQPGANVATVRIVAERCRHVGALDLAAALYRRLVELGDVDEQTVALAEVLGGAPPRTDHTDGLLVPVPLVQVPDFLPAAVHERVLSMAKDAIGQFAPSEVYADGHGRLDTSQRISAILRNDDEFRALFMPYVEAVVDDTSLWTRLGVSRSGKGHKELQVTCSGAGAFFRAHTDSGKERFSSRRLTFVYYFNFQPRRFTGGDLRVYDGLSGKDGFSVNHYSLVEPQDNSIVLFPSTAVHEVTRVECETENLLDGRFTINGWFH
jgi:hypothetical protein